MKNSMSDRRRMFYLLVIMVAIVLAVVFIAVGILYRTTIDEQKTRVNFGPLIPVVVAHH